MPGRIGKNERNTINNLLKRTRAFRIFKQQKNKSEVYFNDLLINHLKQTKLSVKNRGIHSSNMFGEVFRPECYVDSDGSYPLCAFECKKLTDSSAKSRWKEGLSQSILYSRRYNL